MHEGIATNVKHELVQLRDYERQLLDRLRQRSSVARNVNIEHAEQRTVGDRVADRGAAMVGSWRFVIVQSMLLALWIILSSVAWVYRWDPYPFILMNLALSFQAAYTAPIIMLSQNRQAEKDPLRAEHDYTTNIKAELEIQDLHTKLDLLRVAQWEELLELQRHQLALLEQLVAPSTSPTQADSRQQDHLPG